MKKVRRRTDLTFYHHEVVAAREDRHELLAMAARQAGRGGPRTGGLLGESDAAVRWLLCR